MIQQLKAWDEQLLLFLNHYHADWLDPVVFLITRTEFWIPLYLLLLFVTFRHYRKEGWLVLIGVAVAILLADRITSGLMKPLFLRLRPSHEPALEGLLHLVNDYRGGAYGFASSHAANTMGVAFFFYMLFRNVTRWISMMFIWAIIMSYTRIYLGVHYPGDILIGALVGILSGYAGFKVFRALQSRLHKDSV